MADPLVPCHRCEGSGLVPMEPALKKTLELLTATPHSGDEAAFYNLLSLLDPAFVGLQSRTSADDPLRQQLARHFVQRRRKDIVEWQAETHDGRGFARRMKTELTYKLTGDWGAFFDAVQTYCREMAESVEQTQQGSARLIWYATLALLRTAGPLCLWQVCHRLGRMRGTFIASEGVEVALHTLAARRLAEQCLIDIETADGPATATGWRAS